MNLSHHVENSDFDDGLVSPSFYNLIIHTCFDCQGIPKNPSIIQDIYQGWDHLATLPDFSSYAQCLIKRILVKIQNPNFVKTCLFEHEEQTRTILMDLKLDDYINLDPKICVHLVSELLKALKICPINKMGDPFVEEDIFIQRVDYVRKIIEEPQQTILEKVDNESKAKLQTFFDQIDWNFRIFHYISLRYDSNDYRKSWKPHESWLQLCSKFRNSATLEFFLINNLEPTEIDLFFDSFIHEKYAIILPILTNCMESILKICNYFAYDIIPLILSYAITQPI